MTEIQLIGFWGYPYPKLIQETKIKYPNAKWVDLDIDFAYPKTNILPEAYCKIIRNIIDNTIRANCLSKFVLACANVAQSNTICGQKIGVELLGKGDGYAILDGVVKPIRFQAPLYDDETRKALYKIVP